ncbi:MAG: enoyl-CoA hydratase/isomerase [Sphingomonadales bacterium]|nr:enoyl-CoA hydratase/isomerase [Sphingomonadales bacterium]
MEPHHFPDPTVITGDETLFPGVLIVTLVRPDERNAMSGAMVESLLGLFEGHPARNAGAILITGAGRGFCAGSDLGELAAMGANERQAFEAASGLLARQMVAHPRPIVAAVHGFAIGGGLTLAAACDFVVSSPIAKWSLPEVPIGLFPAWGLEAVERRVGRARARQLSFGLDTLDGATAAHWGLADVIADDPFATGCALAQRLAALPYAQVAAVKDYFARTREGAEADEYANRLFIEACATDTATASFIRYARAR